MRLTVCYALESKRTEAKANPIPAILNACEASRHTNSEKETKERKRHAYRNCFPDDGEAIQDWNERSQAKHWHVTTRFGKFA